MQLVLPYIEQGAVFQRYVTLNLTPYVTNYNVAVAGGRGGPNGPIGNSTVLREARHMALATFSCPTDHGNTGNELGTSMYGARRGNYRACTGTGDMYGRATDTTAGPWGVGVFGVTAGQSFDRGVRNLSATIPAISDGTSNTLMLAEGLVPQNTNGWGGPIGMIIYGNMGGALFSATLTPNSTSPDRIVGPCPQTNGDAGYRGPCLTLGGNAWWTPSAAGAHAAARSFHTGGVNAAMADGSIRFFRDGTDLFAWRAMGTRAGGEVFSNQ
jgi:prepilin-type processing-associated H-X9-DG protein